MVSHSSSRTQLRVAMRRPGTAAAAMVSFVLASAPVQAACGRADAMPDEAVSALVRDPLSLLRRHSGADAGLAEEAQAVVISGPNGAAALLAAARSGTYAQQDQIGRGVGRAYHSCLQARSPIAATIVASFQHSDMPRLTSAFRRAADIGATTSALAVLEKPAEEIGTSPSSIFGSQVPDRDLTARVGPFALPPLSGPLPNPFDQIK